MIHFVKTCNVNNAVIVPIDLSDENDRYKACLNKVRKHLGIEGPLSNATPAERRVYLNCQTWLKVVFEQHRLYWQSHNWITAHLWDSSPHIETSVKVRNKIDAHRWWIENPVTFAVNLNDGNTLIFILNIEEPV